MIPKSYTEKDNEVHFHYSFSDLRKFIEHGREFGNNGFIIINKIDQMIRYRGYGTIENPSKSLFGLTVAHFPLFDGEFSIEAIMNPKPIFTKENTRFVILDLSKKKDEP